MLENPNNDNSTSQILSILLGLILVILIKKLPYNWRNFLSLVKNKITIWKKLFIISVIFTILYYKFEEIFPPPKFFELDPIYKNICLNGKDKSLMSNFEILKEFTKGPCSPIIFAPGLGGVNIKIDIDCEEMQKNDFETFSSCGWNTCSTNKFYQIWPFYRKPKSDYNMWMPDVISPMSILLPRFLTETCFYNISKTVYNHKATSIKDLIIKRPGITYSWHGDTKNTKGFLNSKCGVDA